MALASELASLLPQLERLRRLTLCLEERPLTEATAARLGQLPLYHAHQHQQQMGLQAAPRRGGTLTAVVGLPMLRLTGCLRRLPQLSCLHLRLQPLHASDIAELAALTALTELALLWNPDPHAPPHRHVHGHGHGHGHGLAPAGAPLPGPGPAPAPLRLSAAAWTGLMTGLAARVEVLDVDFGGGDVRERLSLAPLRRLRVLRLRRCDSADLLLSLMGPTGGGGGSGGAGGAGGREAGPVSASVVAAAVPPTSAAAVARVLQSASASPGGSAAAGASTAAGTAAAVGLRRGVGGGVRAGLGSAPPRAAGPGGGLSSGSGGGSGVGGGGLGVGSGSGASVGVVGGGVGSGAFCTLSRLELPDAGEHVTPALVAQVCSRLAGLRVLDVSRAFRSRARFQLGGDLLVRDLAVLCPQLVQLVLYDVPLHGVGLPDSGRDFALLPFISPDDPSPVPVAPASTLPPGSWPYSSPSPLSYGASPLLGASGGGRSTAEGAATAASSSGTTSQSSQAGAGAAAAAAAVSVREPVQMPFPRLTRLVVQGGPVFMKSRFRSIANLRALQELWITGMTEKDFLATCKMGCYAPLADFTALTALHITAAPQPHPVQPHPIQPHLQPHPAQAQAPPGPAAPPQAFPAAEPGQPGEGAGVAAGPQAAGPGQPQPQPLPGAAGGGAGAPAGPGWGQAAGLAPGGGVPPGAWIGPGAAGPGPSGPSMAGPSWSAMRREPHLNFITQLGSLRVLTLEALTTRGLVFSYLAQLRHLRFLSLGGCIDLSFDGLDKLRHATMPGLRSLRMLGCLWESYEASREVLPCLAAAAPGLVQLELGSCPGVIAHSLAAVLPGLPRLRYVRLHGAKIDPHVIGMVDLSSSSLRFLSCVVSSGTTPPGGSFSMARHNGVLELISEEDAGWGPAGGSAAAAAWGPAGDGGPAGQLGAAPGQQAVGWLAD